MPRLLRHWVPGGIYHITARGNNREPIFHDSVDYQQYLLQLRQCRDALPYRLLAFALMPNHVHLVFEMLLAASLSDVMQRVGKGYADYFNSRYERVGHVYQGRFYSSFVNREAYLLEVTRYVHLNPVRAGLCRQPHSYQWSSYQFYIRAEADPLGLVEPTPILSLFGSSQTGQVNRYRMFVEEMVQHEEKQRRWLLKLRRDRLIPPKQWLEQVPRTYSALTGTRYLLTSL